MRLLFLGDVVGRPGRRAVRAVLPRLIAREGADFVVANCENASGGKGIDPYITENRRLLRPHNFAPGVPGTGCAVHRARKSETSVGVLNLIGRVFMGPADCPFRAAEAAVAELRREATVILVDMHAEATSEKVAMGRFLDGRVSAVVGSHTHVQTADEEILAGGTAYLTDAGMCGPLSSVLGVRSDQVLRRFLTQMPTRFDVASGPVIVQGAVIDVDPASGRASMVRRIRERVDE